MRTYLQTFDNTVKKFVPLDLFPDQLKLVEDYDEFNENIALKYRQAGVSTVTAAWSSKKLAFGKKNNPEKILIIANKLDTAVEFANKIRSFTEQWPSWVGVGFSDEKNSQRHFRLTNGCEVKAVATSKDALRGYTPTILIFDEAAYIEADDDFWAACMASLSTGGKVIVISTPNGYDPIYYEIYEQALRNMNTFKISEMFWFKDPRYNKDLYMVKVEDLTDYLLNRENYKNIEIIDLKVDNPYERDYGVVTDYIKQGFKPCSSWFEGMVKKLKYDKRKVAQELECNFLGSGDNVFDSNLLTKIKDNDVRDPEGQMMGGALWIWKEPALTHRYIMGVDVSRGDSEDFSCIEVIDFDEREQVFEYVGKIPPDVLAEIAFKWGKLYNALIVTDLTGGMGVATARKLQELGYKNLYVEGVNDRNRFKWDPKREEKIPGINFNSKRVQIIASLEEAIRHGFKVKSQRLLNEMGKFIYVNGRPDHQKGHHDDTIMSIAMAIYVGDTAFQSLQKVVSQTKVMLDAWQTNVNENAVKSDFFNPMVPSVGTNARIGWMNDPTKEDYQKYSWLFKGR